MLTRMFNYIVILLALVSASSTKAHVHESHSRQQQQAAFVVLESSRTGPSLKYSNNQGELQSLYRIPRHGKVFQFSHSSTKSELLLSYAPPGNKQQGIWRLEYVLRPAQKATIRLTPVITNNSSDTWFFDPVSVPGTDNFYYVSAESMPNQQRATKKLQLWFYDAAEKTSVLVSDNASHPAISETGKLLLWQSQKTDSQLLNVLDQESLQMTKLSVTKALPDIKYPLVSEALQSLFFLSKEQTTDHALIPGFSTAWAHPGQHDAIWYGWQAPLESGELKSAKLLWEAENIRMLHLHPAGKKLVYINEAGIQQFDVSSGETQMLLAGPNFWKMALIAEH